MVSACGIQSVAYSVEASENNPDLRKLYLESDLALREKRAAIAKRLIVICMISGVVFDYFIYPNLFIQFLKIRLLFLLMVGCISGFLHKRNFLGKYPRRSYFYIYTWMLLLYISIAWTIYLSGGVLSTYYAGLNLVTLSACLLLPLYLKEAIALNIFVLVLYLVVCFAAGNLSSYINLLYNNLYFLLFTGVASAIAAHFNAKKRFEEFTLRHELACKNGVLLDLTNTLQEKVEEKTAELNDKNKTLEQANLRLKDLDKRKNEFLANTSHELRTPLHGIMGFSQFLAKTLASKISASELEGLQLIHQSGTRLNYLINDILDSSKIQENTLELMLTEVDIQLLIKNMLVLLRPQMMHHNLVLINELSDDLPKVLADEHRMQQILYNLIGNAIKFTPKGFIRIHAEVELGFLKIFITDAGIGIPSNKLESIFDAFEQVDGSTSRRYGGAGLGLSITKKLIELHQGKIGVKSSIGGGSCFYFSVPLAGNSRGRISSGRDLQMQLIESSSPEFVVGKISPQMQQSFQRLQLLPKATVLMVDDDEINIGVTKNLLSSIGAKVITTNSGRAALSLLETLTKDQLPDLILLDVMMPDLNGYEVARNIRATLSAILPIVMLTALKENSNALYQGFATGANDFLSKPYNETELFMRLESVLYSYAFFKAQQRKQREIG